MTENEYPRESPNRYDEAREELRDRSLPGVDVASLLDYIDALEDAYYDGHIPTTPEKRIDEAVFDVGVHVGFACGLRDGMRPAREDKE